MSKQMRDEVINQETTNGSLFVNFYEDGTFEVESINGGSVRGTGEEWIFIFQILVPRLRTKSR